MHESGSFRHFLELTKQKDHAGNPRSAFAFLGRARKDASQGDSRHKYEIGIIDHRHALLEARYGDADDARRMFKRASREIKYDAPIERANLLRDFGKFELQVGNTLLARKKINEALALLESADKSLDQLDTHIAITRGFLAQVALATDRIGALHTLRETALALRGERPEYELEPVECLVENLPAGIERQLYVVRAIYLSLALGSRSRATEFAALLGGKPLRKLYRLIL